MTPLGWMCSASAVSWLIVTAIAPDRSHPEALWGMLGPLASAGASWMAFERAHRTGPQRLMQAVMAAFPVQMLFFAAYVTVVLRGWDARPVPFVMSFTAYFILLLVMEAWFLRRLTANAPRTAAG